MLQIWFSWLSWSNGGHHYDVHSSRYMTVTFSVQPYFECAIDSIYHLIMIWTHGSCLLTRLWSSNISWWFGSTERAARQSLRAPKTSSLCSWKAARRCKRCKSALNAIALESSAMASSSLWLSINTATTNTKTLQHYWAISNRTISQ